MMKKKSYYDLCFACHYIDIDTDNQEGNIKSIKTQEYWHANDQTGI